MRAEMPAWVLNNTTLQWPDTVQFNLWTSCLIFAWKHFNSSCKWLSHRQIETRVQSSNFICFTNNAWKLVINCRCVWHIVEQKRVTFNSMTPFLLSPSFLPPPVLFHFRGMPGASRWQSGWVWDTIWTCPTPWCSRSWTRLRSRSAGRSAKSWRSKKAQRTCER